MPKSPNPLKNPLNPIKNPLFLLFILFVFGFYVTKIKTIGKMHLYFYGNFMGILLVFLGIFMGFWGNVGFCWVLLCGFFGGGSWGKEWWGWGSMLILIANFLWETLVQWSYWDCVNFFGVLFEIYLLVIFFFFWNSYFIIECNTLNCHFKRILILDL